MKPTKKTNAIDLRMKNRIRIDFEGSRLYIAPEFVLSNDSLMINVTHGLLGMIIGVMPSRILIDFLWIFVRKCRAKKNKMKEKKEEDNEAANNGQKVN
jgi:hypothetical protein